ncbi:hypothetical protein RZS08_27935, partial [Arthrospira platensis SPKY1]|nr:hypothetical protein [Arthrospira platensis SPKY1]
PKGQAFALLEGGQLAKLRFPLPKGDAQDPHWPDNLQTVFVGMHAQYQRYVQSLGVDPDVTDAHDYDVLTVQGRGHG